MYPRSLTNTMSALTFVCVLSWAYLCSGVRDISGSGFRPRFATTFICGRRAIFGLCALRTVRARARLDARICWADRTFIFFFVRFFFSIGPCGAREALLTRGRWNWYE